MIEIVDHYSHSNARAILVVNDWKIHVVASVLFIVSTADQTSNLELALPYSQWPPRPPAHSLENRDSMHVGNDAIGVSIFALSPGASTLARIKLVPAVFGAGLHISWSDR